MPPDPRSTEQSAYAVLQVFQAIGYAVWLLQALDETLLTYHVLVHELDPGCGRDALVAAIEIRRRQTLGKLLDLPGMAAGLSRDLQQRLDSFLHERNWLVHRSWRESHIKLNTLDGPALMLSRIGAVAEEAKALAAEIQRVIEPALAQKGISAETIDQLSGAVLGSWDSGQRNPGEVV